MTSVVMCVHVFPGEQGCQLIRGDYGLTDGRAPVSLVPRRHDRGTGGTGALARRTSSAALCGASAAVCGASAALHGDEIAVPAERGLRRAPLSAEVDMHEAEPLVVALGPLEIVDQRPDQVTAHVDASDDRLAHRPDMAVQVADPRLVVDGPVGGYRVIRRAAILGNPDRRQGLAVPLLQ